MKTRDPSTGPAPEPQLPDAAALSALRAWHEGLSSCEAVARFIPERRATGGSSRAVIGAIRRHIAAYATSRQPRDLVGHFSGPARKGAAAARAVAQAVEALRQAPIPQPLIGDDVGRWLPPRVAAVLRRSGIRTLAELTLRVPRRKRWWRGIAGLGPAMGGQVESFFAAHPDLTERARALAGALPTVVFMSAVVGQAQPVAPAPEAAATPYEQVSVTLTKQEHVQLVTQAHNWKSLHQRAVARIEQQRQQFDQALDRIKALEKLVQAHERVRLREVALREQLVCSLEQARLREATLRKQHERDLEQAQQQQAALREQLAQEQAYSRELRHRLFGQRSEKSHALNKVSTSSREHKRPRGQQPGRPGHGRTRLTQLPVVEESAELDAPVCPRCGLALQAFPGSDDCDVVEFEVRAWRRVIHRRRYHPVCQCGCLPGIVAAPAPPRLIPRGKLGVSVWVHLLLGKYLHGQPLHRLLQDWEDQGLHLSAGTVTDGLHRLTPMFEPLQQALLDYLRRQTHWHADETRWEVFVEREGKRGHRWYLWVFHTPTVAYYTLDPSRASKVPKQVLAGCDEGILSVDRCSAYKGYVNKHPGVHLSFCWAHQRRDFLRVANDYPHLESWAMSWVDRIGELYKLHAQRQEAGLASTEFNVRDQQLRQAVQSMCQSCEQSLAEGRLAAPALKALQSLQRHWQGLTLFVEQPWLPLDNNAAERALRPAVVGRKNFYGSGSQWSGEVGATLMSLLMTVKLWKINARAWLSAYLNACATEGGRAPNDLSAFVPWQMNEAQLAAMRAGPAKAPHGINSS